MTSDSLELFEIVKTSLWGGEVQNKDIPDRIRKELQAQSVEGLTAIKYPNSDNLKYKQAARFVQMVAAQNSAVKLLQDSGILVAVLKGTASGINYPIPYLRTYGDIDLIVLPKYYLIAIDILKLNSYIQESDIGKSNTAFSKDGFLFELHKNSPGMEDVPETSYLIPFMENGFTDIQTVCINNPRCEFPILPWQQNGLELIWHFRVHLYNGIGLRHVIDWMMFVHQYLDDKAFIDFQDVLKKAAVLVIAKTVTRMCQIYLGLEETITWCSDVKEEICADLMEYILDQGNFGHKRHDDKTAKVLTKYRTPFLFLKGMQNKGLLTWRAVKKHPFLQPFAWLYVGIMGVRYYANPAGLDKLKSNYAENLQRRQLFDQLYGERIKTTNIKASHETVTSDTTIVNHRNRSSFLLRKQRSLYELICNTPFRIPIYHLQNMYFNCCYLLLGKPHISDSDRRNVEKNITFIYKSFNRQKKATKLYRCIKAYYPQARVIIADDSKNPLDINRMSEHDLILHLPFNSGLSKGLIAALDQVKTSYVMRLDDDELLTPRSIIHKHLSFLQQHNEVDLVGLQGNFRHPEKRAVKTSSYRMNKNLLIPAGTIIEGYEVVYKPLNIYLIRTESLRKVGYDPNIRMTDHQEFFFRAAGQIVCVQDPHSYVMHCHNYFEKKEYRIYRRDYIGDAQYIAQKHKSGYQ